MMRLAFSLFLLGLSACVTHKQTARLTWTHGGDVLSGDQKLSTDLQNVTTALLVEEGLFLGGYKIDAEGINYPHAVFVPNDLANEQYWPWDESIQVFFTYRGSVHLLETGGRAHKLIRGRWEVSQLNFKPRSVVLRSDDDIVACNPRGLRMTSKVRGSCYSPTRKWDVSVNWTSVEPRICNERLTVVETLNDAVRARQFRLGDGVELATRDLEATPADPCMVEFTP